jgi:pyruvate/2-oxoglutarate dehydrogenase complex dihydrolipoamide dehydrogenase (E3) component
MAEVDVVVIGLGVGGEFLSTRLAEGGCSVVGIEANLVGGECPYYGCVPTKMIVRAANVLEEARRVDALAGKATVTPDWSVVARRIREDATDNWDDAVAVKRLEDAGVRVVRGRARLVARDRVVVGDDEFVARRAVVIATGSEPAIPPVDGLDAVPYLTNRDFVALDELPSSLVVMGGGAIGLEIAQATHRFGTDVTVVEAADRIAFREEPETSALLTEVFEGEGIDVRVGAGVERVTGDESPEGREVTLHLADGTTVVGERLLVATGRQCDLRALGVGAAGLDEDARVIGVDEHLRAAPGVYAIGDVTGAGAFTHVAAYHARIAAASILGHDTDPAETRAIPRVTFTDPEVGSVGLTEADAREQGIDVVIGHADASNSARGWMHAANDGGGTPELVKLVVDRKEQVLIGATVAGPMGGEVLAMLTLAVHARVPVPKLHSMVFAYPTFHRTIESALDTSETG